MKPSERTTMNITLNVDGKALRFVINRDDETAYREAAKSINEEVLKLKGRFANTVKGWEDEMAVRYAAVLSKVEGIRSQGDVEDTKGRMIRLAKELDDAIGEY